MNARRPLPSLVASLVAFSFTAGAAGHALADAKADPFKIEVSAPAAKVGQASVASIVIKPGPGYHMNKQYPTVLTLTPTQGVTAPAKLGKKDAEVVKIEEAAASFDVKYTASEAGAKKVSGTVKFAVCTATDCDARSVPVTLNLDVK